MPNVKLKLPFLPSGEDAGSVLRTGWDHLKDLPLGKRLFSQAIGRLAPYTGSMATAYTMPNDARFVVAGLSIEYGKKARGNITATAECPAIERNARAEYPVTVTMRDPQGDVVASCVLRTLVGPLR